MTRENRGNVYGPVPSRRLGQSLGVSPIPLKTCTFSCVYCQLGRTNHLTVDREEFYPREEMIQEIRQALDESEGHMDFIAFVGEGEPTLNSSIGWLIQETRRMTKKGIAVITNGSLLFRKDVREELLDSDVVLPSLDAGNPILFRKVNRPHPSLDFREVLGGLIEFRDSYDGKIWLEIMLVRDLNDSMEALLQLRQAVEKIKPDKVHLNVPIRPPTEAWVRVPGEESLSRARSVFPEAEEIFDLEEGMFGSASLTSTEDAILRIIRRHPMREDQIYRTLREWGVEDAEGAMKSLEKDGRIERVDYRGKTFYRCTE